MLKKLFQHKHLWRKKPEIDTTPNHEERKVNWLDLFFDLVFVVTIGQLAHLFHGELTRAILGEFTVLFFPVRWLWIGATYYTARFEENTIRHRIYIMFLMIPVLGMGYGIHGAISGDASWYIRSYIVAKLLLGRMWYSASISQEQSKDQQKIGKGILVANLFSLLRVGSLFVDGGLRYAIRLFSMVCELGRSWTQRSDTTDDIPDFHMGHLTERFGLFTIIVLAEIIIGVFSGLSEVHHLDISIIITAIASFLIACLLRWIYFDQIMSRPLIKTEGENAQLFLRTYGHLPLTLGIVIVGGSLTHIIGSPEHISDMNIGFIVIGLHLFLFTMGGILQFHQAKTHEGIELKSIGKHSLNKHLGISKIIAGIAVFVWGRVWLEFHLLEAYRFVIGVTIILAGLAIEGLVYWVFAVIEKE